MIYVLVALLQMILSILKVFDIKWSYENKVLKLTILNFIMSGVWILGTALGVSAVIKGDVTMMFIYIIFGGLGKVVAIKVFRQNKYRSTLYRKLKDTS